MYRLICADKYNGDWNCKPVSQKQAFQVSIQSYKESGAFSKLASSVDLP
jgi:hypothetical protein